MTSRGSPFRLQRREGKGDYGRCNLGGSHTCFNRCGVEKKRRDLRVKTANLDNFGMKAATAAAEKRGALKVMWMKGHAYTVSETCDIANRHMQLPHCFVFSKLCTCQA